LHISIHDGVYGTDLCALQLAVYMAM